MLTNRPFAGKDLPIRYRIFNVGNAAAHDVTLEDEWSPEEFQPVSGLQTGTWSHIAPGANMSHIVVLRPYSYGYKSSAAAKVTYKHAASDSEVQTSFSNDLGLVPVLSSKDDDKLAAPHMTEWLIFISMALALAALPIILFRPPQSAKSKKA
mmetsp:Transcript_98458/g.144145  ORF Transcript_98458/g.144145 Transcript_98458/m.144145 type:complete len:152 (+) Transcript_98458:111-566(+)